MKIDTLNKFEALNETELELDGGKGEGAFGYLLGWVSSEANKNKHKYCDQYDTINGRSSCYYLWEN